MYRIPIDNGLFDFYKGVLLKTKGTSVKFIDSVIIKVNGCDIGVLKYTFTSSENRHCFGSQIFFRTSIDEFYEMEIYSLGKPVQEFQIISDRIIASLNIE
jgi:hypothetical protein